jgi:hypothetical protein
MEEKKIKLFTYDLNLKIKDYYKTYTYNKNVDEMLSYIKKGHKIIGFINKFREGTNIVEGYVVLK